MSFPSRPAPPPERSSARPLARLSGVTADWLAHNGLVSATTRLAPRPARKAPVLQRPLLARIAAVGSALPAEVRTSAEVEARIRAASPACTFRAGLVEVLTGVSERRVVAEGEYGSDLAAAAARQALERAEVDVAEVDLLIFASAGSDLAEPATANIVQEK